VTLCMAGAPAAVVHGAPLGGGLLCLPLRRPRAAGVPCGRAGVGAAQLPPRTMCIGVVHPPAASITESDTHTALSQRLQRPISRGEAQHQSQIRSAFDRATRLCAQHHASKRGIPHPTSREPPKAPEVGNGLVLAALVPCVGLHPLIDAASMWPMICRQPTAPGRRLQRVMAVQEVTRHLAAGNPHMHAHAAG
jgi:hypothetical protein